GLIPEKHVGPALGFAARKPGRHQSLDLRQLTGDDLWPATDDDNHAGRDRGTYLVDRGSVAARQVQRVTVIADIAHTFGVRRLADHDDADLGTGHRSGRIGAVRHVRVIG